MIHGYQVCQPPFLAERDIWQAFSEIRREFQALKKPRASVTTHASAGADAISNAEVVDPRSLISLSATSVPEEVLKIVAVWANCQNEEDLQVGGGHHSRAFD